jgi:hypothetical protein
LYKQSHDTVTNRCYAAKGFNKPYHSGGNYYRHSETTGAMLMALLHAGKTAPVNNRGGFVL